MKKSKVEMLEDMKNLGAEIGMIETKRMTGEYVSIHTLRAKKREFYNLSRTYKKLYFQVEGVN